MPYVTTDDGIQSYYEEAGSGDTVLFVHEFGGDHRSWEPQIRFFSRRYRCITYGACTQVPETQDGSTVYSCATVVPNCSSHNDDTYMS